ncbi:unnamed protein product, partial [Darwinula stevensoni]
MQVHDGIYGKCQKNGLNCSQLCVWLPDGNASCTCYEEYELASDNVTCIDTGKTRFLSGIKIRNMHVDLSAVNNSSREYLGLKENLGEHIFHFLKSHISSATNFSILNFGPGAVANFHFFGDRWESALAMNAITQAVARGAMGNLSIDSQYIWFEREPSLNLKRLTAQQSLPIQRGHSLTLKCIAAGSTEMKFNWFKDDAPINVTQTSRYKSLSGSISHDPSKSHDVEPSWSRFAFRKSWMTVLPKNSADEFTSILTLEAVMELDEGLFTCRVEDWGHVQERSIMISVDIPPSIHLTPYSLTLQKGQSTVLTCTANNDPRGVRGYNWAKNGNLITPGASHAIEDLYPDGSRLKIYNISSSGNYACIAVNGAGESSTIVRVEVLDPELENSCQESIHSGVKWSETATNHEAAVSCPGGSIGIMKRKCILRSVLEPSVWGEVDSSGCISTSMHELMENVRFTWYTGLRWAGNSAFPQHRFILQMKLLEMGYQVVKAEDVSAFIWKEVSSRSKINPGEGEQILSLLARVDQYMKTFKHWDSFLSSSKNFYNVIEYFLANPSSILHNDKTVRLTRVLEDHVMTEAANTLNVTMVRESHFTAYAFPLRAAQGRQKVPVPPIDANLERKSYNTTSDRIPGYLKERLEISFYALETDPVGPKSPALIASTIFYTNLSALLPKRYVTRHVGWEDMEYELCSEVVQVSMKREGQELGNVPGGIQLSITFPLDATSFFILVVHWWQDKNILSLSKMQEVLAISVISATVGFSARSSLAQSAYPYVITILAFFFILTMSAQLSRSLLIYVEDHAVQPVNRRKLKVFAISVGLPCVVTFSTISAQEMQGWDLQSWWLTTDSMYFHTTIVPYALLLCIHCWLFSIAFMTVKQFANGEDKAKALLAETRKKLLIQSWPVLLTNTGVFISSIVYINAPYLAAKVTLSAFFILT